MPIYVKNQRLKTQVFKSMDYWDTLSLKAYKQGDLKKGKKYENKSDKIYRENYHKIFKVVRV